MTVRRFFRILRHRVRSIWRPGELDAQAAREFDFHFQQLVTEHRAEGLSEDAARRAAHRALGNAALFQEQIRDARGVRWLHDFQQDVVYGLRVLGRHRGFTAVAVASLALGIGTNAAMLGAIDAVFVQQLPFRDANRLAVIRMYPQDHPEQMSGISMADYFDWKDRVQSFESLGLSMPWPADFGAGENGAPPERLLGQVFTADTFTTLGVRPILGRTFLKEEGQLGPAARVVVISYGLWQRRFGGDPDILGKAILIDAVSRTIVGIMPPTFKYQDAGVEFWLPLIVYAAQAQNPSRLYGLVGRVKPGVTLAEAQAELTTITTRAAAASPKGDRGWRARVMPIRDALYGWTIAPLLTLQAAVTLLFVVACANLAALMLVRGGIRAREIRLRVALGAGRWRISRQLLTEGLLLSLAGGVLGLLVAWMGLRGLAAALAPPLGSPQVPDLGLSLRVIAVTFALATASVLSFGLAPALKTAAGAMRNIGESRLAPRLSRSSGPLVAAEVALAAILLVGSGLLTKSFIRLTDRDLGFDPNGLVTFDFRAPGPYAKPIGDYRGDQYFEINPAPARLLQRIHERLRTLPGVDAAAGISHALLDSPTVPVVPIASPDRPMVSYALVTPGFFATVRATHLRGRDISDADSFGTPWVAIVNESAERLLWPGQDAIGRQITLDIVPDERPREVIGVVRDLPLRRAQVDPEPVVYASYLQQPPRFRAPWSMLFGQMTFVLRHAGAPLDVLPAARRALAEIEPTRPVANVGAVADLSVPLVRQRSYVFVINLFAAAATLLAGMGVYGVVSRAVHERIREIGIRRALGARSADVVSLLGRRLSALMAAGLVAGLAGALALTRLIASQLWGVPPNDPATFATAALLLAAAGVVACVPPARRALSVDPTVTLRSE